MKRRSNAQWQELFAQQEGSGLSAAAFCQQHDLCPKYFSLRRKQLAKRADEMAPGFIRAQVKPETRQDNNGVAAHSLIIHNKNGRLDFAILPPPHWLAQLLRELA